MSQHHLLRRDESLILAALTEAEQQNDKVSLEKLYQTFEEVWGEGSCRKAYVSYLIQHMLKSEVIWKNGDDYYVNWVEGKKRLLKSTEAPKVEKAKPKEQPKSLKRNKIYSISSSASSSEEPPSKKPKQETQKLPTEPPKENEKEKEKEKEEKEKKEKEEKEKKEKKEKKKEKKKKKAEKEEKKKKNWETWDKVSIQVDHLDDQ